ncbi:MAG TPA: hypothetical protein VK849_11655, partial [Longimicrobiales bacterium]|nr:hypothetical protein [Longimicrobiales bacterium]
MDLRDKTVLILGGAGLVGIAVARKALEQRPTRVVIASLRREESEEAVAELREDPNAGGVALEAVWGDLFVPHEMKDRPRSELLADPVARARLVDDLYDELTESVLARSTLGRLVADVRPQIVVDSVNTA